MKKTILSGVIGFLLGAITFGVVGFFAAPGIMMSEDLSPLGYEETVQAISDSAAEQGWSVPKMYELDKSVAGDGFDVLPVTVIELCHPKHAGRVLEDDDARIVTSLMPCRISVYETSNGDVTISRMNSGLVSKVFGGLVSEVMAQAAAENEIILSAILP